MTWTLFAVVFICVVNVSNQASLVIPIFIFIGWSLMKKMILKVRTPGEKLTLLLLVVGGQLKIYAVVVLLYHSPSFNATILICGPGPRMSLGCLMVYGLSLLTQAFNLTRHFLLMLVSIWLSSMIRLLLFGVKWMMKV